MIVTAQLHLFLCLVLLHGSNLPIQPPTMGQREYINNTWPMALDLVQTDAVFDFSTGTLGFCYPMPFS